MFEWHTTPDYIVTNWTDELFELMVVKMVERKNRETDAMNKTSGKRVTSDGSGLKRMGNMVKVIDNRGN